jgi:hypothetical protein
MKLRALVRLGRSLERARGKQAGDPGAERRGHGIRPVPFASRAANRIHA